MINVAVIGAGRWGPNLIRHFHNNQTSRVAWIVDKDEERLRVAAARFPGVQFSTNAARAFSDKDVAAVIVATPTLTHHELVKAALQAGKHVLVEKPLTNRADQAEALCRLAEERKRVLMVGHVFLYNPGVLYVRQALRSGDLGRLFYMSMVRTNLGPVRTDVDAAWDLASQDISIANYWLDHSPVSVSALGESWGHPGINDTVFATLRYPGNVLVHIHVSWLNPRKTRDITVVGHERMLVFDDMNPVEPVRLYRPRANAARVENPWVDSFEAFRSSVPQGTFQAPALSREEPLREECAHFIRCVETGAPPLTDGAQGLAVVRAVEALERSAKNRGREEDL